MRALTQDARTLGNLSVQLAAEGRWQEALQAAHACLRLAEPGSVLYLWVLHMLACTYVDAGLPHRARPYARAYLRQAATHPQLEPYTPYVVRAMGHIAHQERRLSAAMAWLHRAERLFTARGDWEQAERTAITLAWVLIRLRRPEAALQALSCYKNEGTPEYLRQGALAAIAYLQGHYEEAVVLGKQALDGKSRLAHDLVDAAEISLVIAQALRALGATSEASAYIEHAARFAALQEREIAVLLILLNHGAEGGDPSDSAAVARGSANLRHRGCFCTGVA